MIFHKQECKVVCDLCDREEILINHEIVDGQIFYKVNLGQDLPGWIKLNERTVCDKHNVIIDGYKYVGDQPECLYRIRKLSEASAQ